MDVLVILLFNSITYVRNILKAKSKHQKLVYKEVFRLSIQPKILVDGHLFVVFKKKSSATEAILKVKSRHSEFGLT